MLNRRRYSSKCSSPVAGLGIGPAESAHPRAAHLRVAGLSAILALALAAILAASAFATPLPFGSIDQDKEKAQLEAQKAIKEAGVTLDVNGADIVRIGSSYAVDQDETVAGDVVIIGGALTVEGTINGDAAVIGGSMYLASTSVIKGDAISIGGIIEKEEGARVEGKIIENPEKQVPLGMGEETSGNLTIVEEGDESAPDAGENPGEIVKVGEAIHVARGEVVEGDVVSVSADITIEGKVNGDVVATSGNVTLAPTAEVSGDVVSVFGKVHMEDGAQVDGDVVETSIGGQNVIVRKSEHIPPGGMPSEAELKQKMKQQMVSGGMPTEPKVTYNISLNAPEASDVRLTGSFIDWAPEGIKMEKDDQGTWRARYSFAPGTYLYKFIVDGKAIPDPDVPELKTEDGMGGYATRLEVAGMKSKTAVPIRFSLMKPEAADVRVTGNFRKWDMEGIKMTKDESGTWSVTVPIEPGHILYKFYIDGVWGPDPDVAEKVDDGMGGYATQFTVKAPQMHGFSISTKGGSEVEKPGTHFSPTFDYTRVDGVYLGLIIRNKTNVFPLPRFVVEGGHSKLRERWLYSFEIEQPVIKPFMFSIGGSVYDKTDTYDKEIIGDGENLAAAALVKREYHDYFDRRGATGFVAVRPFAHHTVKLSYSADEYRPLETKAHAAIFRRHSEFPQNPRNSYQIGYDPEIAMMTAEKIALKSMGLAYEFDSRDCDATPCTGLWTRFASEWTGGDFGGDLEFSRYTGDVRFYGKVNTKMRYAVKLAAGGMSVPCERSCACVPAPEYFFPKEFYVGGIGTLPGYGFKEFKGTHMALMNAEYVYMLKGRAGLLFFVDGGDALVKRHDQSTSNMLDSMKMRFDAGVGFRLEQSGMDALTIAVAKRLDDTDRDPVIILRASRPF